MSRCTLPELQEMMKRSRIESTMHPCKEHRVHIVEGGKLRDDLRIDVPVIPTLSLIEPSRAV